MVPSSFFPVASSSSAAAGLGHRDDDMGCCTSLPLLPVAREKSLKHRQVAHP
jgi:hypothetical protein